MNRVRAGSRQFLARFAYAFVEQKNGVLTSTIIDRGIIVRKFFVVLLSILLLLSGCGLAPEGPESVQIDDKTYKTGFYGTLYPYEYSLTEHTLQSDDLTLVRISHDTFELYHADVGSYVEGTIYCEENQYEQALAYYANPENYTFFCTLGVNMTDGTRAQTVELSNVDTVMFDELLSFADRSYYAPFDSKHNSGVETVELPMPDNTVDTRLMFFKESNDALFCSNKGNDYYIIDNSLYMVYQYDYGHGEYEKLIAVKVPEDISTYFVSFMEPFLKQDQL